MSSGPAGGRRIRVPHVYAIIFTLIVLTALASLVIPPGSYDRDESGRVIAGSFVFEEGGVPAHPEDEAAPRPRGWTLVLAVFMAPLRGIEAASPIIAFILAIGGAFKVIERTGAFEAAIRQTVAALRGREYLVIPVSMLLFSAGGAVFGMSEEIIPFVIVFVPLVRALGYDPIVGVAIPVIGSQIGFAGAMVNPFTVGIAQAIAGLAPLSGWEFRSVAWVLVTALGIGYVLYSARRLKRRAPPPAEAEATAGAPSPAAPFTRTHLAVLGILAAGIVVILWGIARFQWYVTEIGAIFLAAGILAGLVARIHGTALAIAFLEGARELVSAALVVGIARGIVLLAGDTRILDTVLYAMATALSGLHGVVSINLMFLFQTLLNFFMPSGSGQAALTIPIMAPLAELVGLTRQMAVLAFQFGDGFSNVIIPTSAVLMGSLEAGRTPYEKWFRFAWPFQLWCLGFGIVMLSIAVLIGYGA